MILLDTHTLIFWALEPEKLSENARLEIHKASVIGVHIISCFEIAVLVEKGKVKFYLSVENWINDALSHPKIETIPLTVSVAIRCTQLPDDFHRDPVDRILAATCLDKNIPLISKDKLIRNWGYIDVVW